MRTPRLPILLLPLAALFWVATTAASAESSKPFLWMVTSGDSTAYLLGSLHVARADLYPLDRRIDAAFEGSDALVVEADATGPDGFAAAALMLVSGTYPPGDSLERHISAQLFRQSADRFARYGLPPEQWTRFEPWLAAMTITMTELQLLGMLPQHGIDVHFLERARGRKKILELESGEEQIKMLDGFSEKEQELFLRYTLRDVDKLGENADEMVKTWKQGDLRGLERLLLEPVRESSELGPIYRKLFDDRNRKMATRIEEWLHAGGTYFVITGAGHLVGEKGLVALLSARHQVAQAGSR